MESLQEDVLNDVRNISNSLDMSIERIYNSSRKVRRYWKPRVQISYNHRLLKGRSNISDTACLPNQMVVFASFQRHSLINIICRSLSQPFARVGQQAANAANFDDYLVRLVCTARSSTGCGNMLIGEDGS